MLWVLHAWQGWFSKETKMSSKCYGFDSNFYAQASLYIKEISNQKTVSNKRTINIMCCRKILTVIMITVCRCWCPPLTMRLLLFVPTSDNGTAVVRAHVWQWDCRCSCPPPTMRLQLLVPTYYNKTAIVGAHLWQWDCYCWCPHVTMRLLLLVPTSNITPLFWNKHN